MQAQPRSTYVMNELAFEVDARPIADKTMHRLQIATPDGGAIALVICRLPQPHGTLAEVVERQLAREQAAVLGFRCIDVRAARAGGGDAVATRVRYREAETEGYQVDLYCCHGGVLFRIGVTSRLCDRDAADACLAGVAASLVFREEGAA